MDCIGFSRQMILLRAGMNIKMYEIASENCIENIGAEIILAGSKAEGIAPTYASDNDIMMVLNKCVCVDKGCQEDNIIVLEAITKDCPPGYTRLCFVNNGATDISEAFYMASEYDIMKGVLLLKSAGFQLYCAQIISRLPFYDGLEKNCATLNGPSCCVITQQTNSIGIETAKTYNDLVPAIPYYSSSIQTEWKKRVRHHEWPLANVIEEVSTMEGYVVPIGHKLSQEKTFEWRICYTTAEIKLINSLNETQIKLYVVFKMINKYVIKQVADYITSYMIKNIVLWMTECSPRSVQCHYNLTGMLLQSLSFLLHCLYNNYLPNYMIPSRNLLLGKIEIDKKQTLTQLITNLIDEGESIVLRCGKLRNAINILVSHQSLACAFRIWRDEVETLILEIGLKMISKTRLDMALQPSFYYDMCFEYWKDESFFVNLFRLFSLLNVDIFSLTRNGMQNYQDIITWLENMLS